MANSDNVGDVIAPLEIILPSRTTNSGARKGMIVVSGSHILVHNGTNFVQLSGSNEA